ncbi:MAG: hypothetical protein ACREQW_14180, partial [Candidatus Binatia bacterium]
MEIVTILPLLNLVLLLGLCLYVSFKAKAAKSAIFFVLSLLSLVVFELGSLLFVLDSSTSLRGAALTLLGSTLLPVTLLPLAQTLARNPETRIARGWLIYHGFQILLFVVLAVEIFTGRMIEWVTGILDQPIFLIDKQHRFLFLNTAIACGVALF